MSDEAKQKVFSGRWTKAEEDYTDALIQEFRAGNLPDTPEGSTLRNFLSEAVACHPKRISKKYEGTDYNGRQQYWRNTQTITDQDALQRLNRLDELRVQFKKSREKSMGNKKVNSINPEDEKKQSGATSTATSTNADSGSSLNPKKSKKKTVAVAGKRRPIGRSKSAPTGCNSLLQDQKKQHAGATGTVKSESRAKVKRSKSVDAVTYKDTAATGSINPPASNMPLPAINQAPSHTMAPKAMAPACTAHQQQLPSTSWDAAISNLLGAPSARNHFSSSSSASSSTHQHFNIAAKAMASVGTPQHQQRPSTIWNAAIPNLPNASPARNHFASAPSKALPMSSSPPSGLTAAFLNTSRLPGLSNGQLASNTSNNNARSSFSLGGLSSTPQTPFRMDAATSTLLLRRQELVRQLAASSSSSSSSSSGANNHSIPRINIPQPPGLPPMMHQHHQNVSATASRFLLQPTNSGSRNAPALSAMTRNIFQNMTGTPGGMAALLARGTQKRDDIIATSLLSDDSYRGPAAKRPRTGDKL